MILFANSYPNMMMGIKREIRLPLLEKRTKLEEKMNNVRMMSIIFLKDHRMNPLAKKTEIKTVQVRW